LINSATIPVYAFILGHTVAIDVASRADIRLVNEKNRYFHLEHIGGNPLTEYKLTINNPSALGFTSGERCIIIKRFRDIVLAMNLTLEEAALAIEPPNLSKPEFSTNEKVKEEVHALVKRVKEQQLNESSIISNLNLIDKVDRHNIEDHKGNTPRHNLVKALNLYEKAFNQTNGEHIFRDIFNAAEDAVNSDIDRSGAKMDIEFSSLVSLPTVDQNKVFHWRKRIYNRIKHPDHNNQPADYLQAKSEIPNELVHLRQAANIVILKRLKNVV
jgi:hypothetical protein